VSLSPPGTSAIIWLIALDVNDKCGAVGGMTGRGNRSTGIKPAQCHFVYHKSHIPHLGSKPGHHDVSNYGGDWLLSEVHSI
jgi:hypothetical protein